MKKKKEKGVGKNSAEINCGKKPLKLSNLFEEGSLIHAVLGWVSVADSAKVRREIV